MGWNEEKRIAEEAFRKISGNLKHMPSEFCLWKKSLNVYKNIFYFIKEKDLRGSLAELRMCLDYQLSIYNLLKPGLTFERQHKLVIFQVIGAIYEGVLFDYFRSLIEKDTNKISKLLGKQRYSQGNFGLGALIDIFYQAGMIEKVGYEYIKNVSYLRNTVHPNSYNKEVAMSAKNNLLTMDMVDILKNLDHFINAMGKKY